MTETAQNVALTPADRELLADALSALWLHPSRRAEITEMCLRTGLTVMRDE